MQLYCYRRDVRFGSKADICAATSDVRFTPNSDRESRHPQKVMSALPPKADMCSANTNVRYGPIADIARANRKTALRRSLQNPTRVDHAASAAAFFFLRQPNNPNAPNPVAKSGSAAGSGVDETTSSSKR